MFVETHSLTKCYRRFTALDACSLSVEAGEVFGLLGPNGAGKTTLLRLLLGYLQPTSGRATIDGLDCQRQSVAARQLVSYLPGEARLYRGMRGRDVLRFFAEVRPGGDFRQALKFAERLDLELNRRVAFMSTGMRQKLAFAATMSSDTPLVILDEPTANLDPSVRATVSEMIVEAKLAGRTVFFSSHVLSEVEDVCDRVAILREGRCVHTQVMSELRRRHRVEASLIGEEIPAVPDELSDSVRVTHCSQGELVIEADELSLLLRWLATLPVTEIKAEPIGLCGLRSVPRQQGRNCMIHVLIRRRIDESKWLLGACSIAMVWFCWLRVWLVSRLDTGRFKEILDLLPSDWQRYTPVDFTWLITYEGRISLVYDELIVVGCVSLWAISRGSDCVSGELGRGTLEMLLAQPLSRRVVMLSQVGVTVVGVAILSFCAWFGTWCGIHTMSAKQVVAPAFHLPIPLPFVGSEIPIPFAEPKTVYVPMVDLVDAGLFATASVNLFTFGLMLAGFSTLMSSWDRYRWRTIGIVVGIYAFQIVAKLFGMSADELAWLKFLSAFTAYEPEALVRIADELPQFTWSFTMRHGDGSWIGYGPMCFHTIMASIGLVSYAVALRVFSRRDLPAPL